MYPMLLVFTLIICGHSLKNKYKKEEVTEVEIQWGQFDEERQMIKPLETAGWYAFYQDNGDEYVRLTGPGGQDRELQAGEAYGVMLEKSFFSGSLFILCIGQPQGGFKLIRTESKCLGDHKNLIIVAVVVGVAVLACCGGCCWFMIRRKKKKTKMPYQGQPQQFRQYQQPMPMTNQNDFAMPSAPM